MMGKTKEEQMVATWIGNEASYMHVDLPEQMGLLDLAILTAGRVLRGVAAGADRFCFEVSGGQLQLWECLNIWTAEGVLPEPVYEAPLADVWDANELRHDEHRMIPDTAAWLSVRDDSSKAKLGTRFVDGDPVGAVGEVVASCLYHLVLNGARTVLVEVERDLCLVMTPDDVAQEVLEKSFDETDNPRNIPLEGLLGG